MVSHFFIGAWSGLAWAAGLVALGVLGHVVNLGLSLRGLRRWTFTAVTMVFGLGGIALTTLFGLALGLDHLQPVPPGRSSRGCMPLPSRVARLVLPMIVGVSDRAYAMFLSRTAGPAVGGAQLVGLATGVPLVVWGALGHPTLLATGGAGIAIAQPPTSGCGRNGPRPARPRLDWALRLLLTGAAFLVPASLLGLAFALGLVEGPRFGLGLCGAGAGGWASLTIAGMMLKIVPFLVWYRVYASPCGREAVPTIEQLSSSAGEAWAGALLVVGVLAVSGALLEGSAAGIRVAGVMLAAGALVLWQPRARPPSRCRRARFDRPPFMRRIALHFPGRARRRPLGQRSAT